MRIIRKIQVKISEQEVFRYLGYKKDFLQKIHLDIQRKVREVISQIYPLLENKGIYQFLEVTSISTNGVISTDQGYGFFINKEMIHLLKNTEYLIFAVVTIGSGVEQAVKKKFHQNQYVKAMIMDAAGTVAVKTVGQWLNHYIEQESSKEDYKLSRYFEPGSGDWDIQEQKKVFEILKPERIGVTLNHSFMMCPAKSLSWIRGMGRDLIQSYRDEFSCRYCLVDNCPFRKNRTS